MNQRLEKMLIHQVKHKNKDRKRVGRGGKKGTYSGKGMKGQKSRAGRKIRPALRDLILKLPKKRGFRFKPIRKKSLAINLNLINEKFNNEEIVNLNSLKIKIPAVFPKSKNNSKVKILGTGEIDKKLIFSRDFLLSKAAREKIIKSGSKIEE